MWVYIQGFLSLTRFNNKFLVESSVSQIFTWSDVSLKEIYISSERSLTQLSSAYHSLNDKIETPVQMIQGAETGERTSLDDIFHDRQVHAVK
jgi:hypothetical protein